MALIALGVTRGIETVEYACGLPVHLSGMNTPNVATGVDAVTLRQPLGVVAAITPFNFPVMVPMWILPIAIARDELTSVTKESVWYIVGLGLMTGVVAHGLIVFAQRTVPIGTIGLLQVATPALAVVWAYLLLDQTLEPIQIVGMALVIIGLVAVVTLTHRSAPTLEPGAPCSDA